MFIQVYAGPHEEDLPLIREALDRALGDSRSDFRAKVHGAMDSTKPASIARVESPYIVLECAATDIDNGLLQERFRAIEGRLRASLPKLNWINPGGGVYYPDDEDAPVSIREGYRHVRPWNLILLLAPIAMVLLAGTSSFRVIWLPPVLALLTATVLNPSSWPGTPDGFPPSIDKGKVLPPLPSPEYDFSTTRDAMESLIKAAKKNDQEAFKRGISSKLLENILSQLPDLAEPMRDVVNQSYEGQISEEGDVSTVNMSDKAGALTVVPLVRENGDWKVAVPTEQP